MNFKNIKSRIQVSVQNGKSTKLGQALIGFASCILIMCFGWVLWTVDSPTSTLLLLVILLIPVWVPLMWIAGHGISKLLELIDEFYDFREKNKGKEEK